MVVLRNKQYAVKSSFDIWDYAAQMRGAKTPEQMAHIRNIVKTYLTGGANHKRNSR